MSGLGNQLFQYAMGRDLALKKRTDLKLDVVSAFENDDSWEEMVIRSSIGT
jgi:hypothetical protein